MMRALSRLLLMLIAGALGSPIADAAPERRDPLEGVKAFADDQPWPIEPPNFVASATNLVIRPRVLVLNFSPRIASEGNKLLWEVFGWHDPRQLAAGFIRDLSYVSSGAVVPEIVEWRDLDEFPAFEDGFRYAPETYLANRRIGAKAPWHEGKADFYAIARQQGIARLVNQDKIDEVWLFGDHYFNLLGEDWMAGPGAFFINGSVFPNFPTDRAFAGYGFNYERHTAEMIHNLGHRTENHMKRAYGGWDRKHPKTPWDRFACNQGETGGEEPFGVGDCHFPPNGRRDYDYTNPAAVSSTALDWLDYPRLTGKVSLVDIDTWTVLGSKRGPADTGVGKGFEHLQYQRWWFSHLPRADGATDDGRQCNWYKYVFDFNAYLPDTGLPRENEAVVSASDSSGQGTNPREIRVRIYNTRGVDVKTLGADDVEVITAEGVYLPVKLVSRGDDRPTTVGFARTVRYELTRDPPPGTWTVRLKAGAIRDRAGEPVKQASVEVAGGQQRDAPAVRSSSLASLYCMR